MADKLRWRYGDTNPVVSPVAAETVIEIGDLVYQEPGTWLTQPADQLAYVDSQWAERFADVFLGVAMQKSRHGEVTPIRVATTGVFEFPCVSGTYRLGELLAAAVGCPPGRDQCCLCNQRVTTANGARSAIGRVAGYVLTPQDDQTVLVDIRSTVMTGGVVVRPRAATVVYDTPVDDIGDLLSVEEFRAAVR